MDDTSSDTDTGNGKRKTVYSWRLVATDSIPAGKRDNAPLREQEKVINRDLNDMITPGWRKA